MTEFHRCGNWDRVDTCHSPSVFSALFVVGHAGQSYEAACAEHDVSIRCNLPLLQFNVVIKIKCCNNHLLNELYFLVIAPDDIHVNTEYWNAVLPVIRTYTSQYGTIMCTMYMWMLANIG